MLGAQNEFTEDSDLFRLALESRECFPELCETLQDETGIDIQYQSSGLIKIANQIEDVEHLRSQFQFLHALDDNVIELSDDELADLTDGSVVASEMAIYIPNDGQINANHYTKALFKSLQQRRISRYFNTNVTDIILQNGYYQIVSSQGDLYAKKIIVAGGAWSSHLLKQYQLPREVVGVKGEVFLMEHDDLNLQQTVFMTNGCYIVQSA